MNRRNFIKILGATAITPMIESCSKLTSTFIDNRSDFEKYHNFMNNKGKRLIDLYRQSDLYPSGCVNMSSLTDILLEEEGINIKTVEGQNKATKYAPQGYHVFNILELDSEKYILDMTKNQLTMPTREVEKEGFIYIEIEDASQGIDSIPYLIKLEGNKEYIIHREINPRNELKDPEALKILKKLSH